MPRKPKTVPLRCFIGIKFPLLQQIQPLLDDLKKLAADESLKLRVSPPQNLHLTLKFIGSVPEDQEVPLQSILSQVSKQLEAFSLNCKGVGFFKNSMWVGIENSEPLQDLVFNLNESLSLLGFAQEDKAFVPHVTLARFAPSAKPVMLEVEKRYKDKEWGVMETPKFHLYRSHTLPEGAKYFILGKYDLGSAG